MVAPSILFTCNSVYFCSTDISQILLFNVQSSCYLTKTNYYNSFVHAVVEGLLILRFMCVFVFIATVYTTTMLKSQYPNPFLLFNVWEPGFLANYWCRIHNRRPTCQATNLAIKLAAIIWFYQIHQHSSRFHELADFSVFLISLLKGRWSSVCRLNAILYQDCDGIVKSLVKFVSKEPHLKPVRKFQVPIEHTWRVLDAIHVIRSIHIRMPFHGLNGIILSRKCLSAHWTQNDHDVSSPSKSSAHIIHNSVEIDRGTRVHPVAAGQ